MLLRSGRKNDASLVHFVSYINPSFPVKQITPGGIKCDVPCNGATGN